MSDTIATAVVGGGIILMLGWLKMDINRLVDRVDDLAQRVARIEGRLDEREHHE